MRLFPLPAAAFLASALSLHAQGPLAPPGAPAPTMKTLDQVEARTPIDAAHTPGDTDATFRINAPGSYYLTGNLTGENGKDGIFVNADDVTIDLNGFTMIGSGGSNSAINATSAPAPRQNITVRNGSVRNWGYGLFLRDRARVERVTVTGNSIDGIQVGRGSIVVDCVAADNAQTGINVDYSAIVRGCAARDNGATGIAAGANTQVSHCIVADNSGIGVVVGSNSTVQNCTANNNGSTGILGGNDVMIADCSARGNGGHGIAGFDALIVRRCTASTNAGAAGIQIEDSGQVMECIANDNGTGATGSGIRAATRALIKQCSATGNRLNGIFVAGDSVVAENRASLNGPLGETTGAGIRVTGSGSRIESNHTRDNKGRGILAGSGDFIVRNTAGGNTGGNFSPNTGANFGPLQGADANPANPHANREF